MPEATTVSEPQNPNTGAQTPAAQAETKTAATTENASSETPTEGTPAKPTNEPSETQISSRFARLASKERDIRAKEESLRAEKAQIEEERQTWAEIKQQNELVSKWKESAKDHPIRALKEVLGLSFDELAQFALKHGTNAPVDVEALVESRISKAREEDRKAREDAESKAAEQYIQQAEEQARRGINQFIQAHQDDCELIIANDAGEHVLSVIKKVFQETGDLIDIAVAAKYVEDDLTAQAQKLLSLKKFAPKPSEETNGASKILKSDEQAPSKPSPTLNNSQVLPSSPAAKHRTQKESFDRAVAILEGKIPPK